VKNVKSLWFCAWLFLGSTGVVNIAEAHIPIGIRATLDASQTKFSKNEKILIDVTYTNVSFAPIRFLKWGTALEGIIAEDFLDIEIKGIRLPYSGIHAKRGQPQLQHYVMLQPGASISAEVDLSLAYQLIDKGRYSLSYQQASKSLIDAKSPVLQIELTQDRPVLLTKQAAIFRNCSVSQQSQIDQALSQAENISRVAINSLNGAPEPLRPTARRYREWFGQFTAGRYEIVRNNMAQIANALRDQRIGFNCECNLPGIQPDFVFAFVSRNDPFNMTLCGLFWRAPLLGTDSRSGTIVHEVSHFSIVADTDDFRPNQAGIRDLARTQPDNAARAANAYEYFAENTPFLSMPTAAGSPPEEPVEPLPEPAPEEPDPVPAFIAAIIKLLFGEDD